MGLPKLTFPLTVDFSGNEYWIGDAGPFPCGAAATEILIGGSLTENTSDSVSLVEDVENFLKTVGGTLHPYNKTPHVPETLFHQMEQHSASCTIHYGYRPIPAQKQLVVVEQYTFFSLRDFLYVELGRGIFYGNTPRQCRLCGNWFLHVHGDKSMYCERIAPGETDKTCREVGARAVFENKIQNDDAWRLYKRAYKKYYARVMKGTMTREDFNVWVQQAMELRDGTIAQMEKTISIAMRKQTIERLQKELNRL